MLNSVMTVLERRTVFRADATTAPFEAGWASEAIFFVQSPDLPGPIMVTPEISPDSFAWTTCGAEQVLEPGMDVVAVPLTNFGTWIRLRIEGPRSKAPVTLLIHLSLKG